MFGGDDRIMLNAAHGMSSNLRNASSSGEMYVLFCDEVKNMTIDLTYVRALCIVGTRSRRL